MKKYGCLIFLILCVSLAVLLFFCIFLLFPLPYGSIKSDAPQDGLWYCTELRAQINFEPELVQQNGNDTLTYMISDDSYIVCTVGGIGSSLNIDNQDLTSRKCGKTLFKGSIVSLDYDTLVVQGTDKTQYTFRRIPRFTLTEDGIVNNVASGISTSHTASVNHYESAANKAKQVWESEFGIDYTLQEYDPTVAIDYTL